MDGEIKYLDPSQFRPRQKDLTGQRFGKLTALRCTTRHTHNGWWWELQCDCGNIHYSPSGPLLYGQVTSCGCSRSESAKERVKRQRDRTLKAQIGEGHGRGFVIYRSSAIQRGIPWELTPNEFRELVTEPCFYCGRPPESWSKSWPEYHNGVDRLDNRLGYIPGNVIPSCETCNKAKLTMGFTEFVAWVKRTYDHLKSKGFLRLL